jgi:hypothetical protein
MIRTKAMPLNGQAATSFPLSAPILRVTIEDLQNGERLAQLKRVFQSWVELEREACTLKRIGVTRFRMPYSYRSNEVPNGAISEQGLCTLTNEHWPDALGKMAKVLDCVGGQLLQAGDHLSATYAALLLRRLRSVHDHALRNNLRRAPSAPWTLELDVARVMIGLPGAIRATALDESLENLEADIRSILRFAPFLGDS